MKVRSRFSYFRDKLQVFFLGFLMGIVLGGGFFVLKLDQYVKDLALYKSLTEKDPQPEHELSDPDKEEVKPKKKPKKTVTVTDTPATDTTDLVAAGDTSLPSVFDTDNSDEIVIRKDELLGQRSVALYDLNQSPGDTTAGSKAYFTVEFWRSPLNYKGYKFSRTRLVLFGFAQEDVASMYRLENETFLKTGSGVFRIEPATDFRQLERVTDEALIAQMQ
jgi:hypothetical protein